jgi:hypothetical protein
MIDEAIVHVGMHKTGSSSIQETFSRLSMDGVKYLRLGGSPNHSGFFGTLLSENPENFHPNHMNGRGVKESRERKFRFLETLHSELSQATENKVIISAELLSAPWVTADMLDDLRSILLTYCTEVSVVGYVRPPIGYMQSAFQQRLKEGNLSELSPKPLYPYYRNRFEKLDTVFGVSKVRLVPFRPADLIDGNVVTDFGKRIGIKVDEGMAVRTNESLSLEACATLFAFRKFVKHAVYDGFTSDNNRHWQCLSRIGGKKLTLSSALVGPVLDAKRSDIDWMSARVGTSIEDAPQASESAVGSEEDLLSVAMENRDALWSLLDEHGQGPAGEAGAAELVDRLQLLVAREPLAYWDAKAQATEDFAVFRDAEQSPEALLREAAQLFSQTEPEVASKLRRVTTSAKRQVSREGAAKAPDKPRPAREAY